MKNKTTNLFLVSVPDQVNKLLINESLCIIIIDFTVTIKFQNCLQFTSTVILYIYNIIYKNNFNRPVRGQIIITRKWCKNKQILFKI